MKKIFYILAGIILVNNSSYAATEDVAARFVLLLSGRNVQEAYKLFSPEAQMKMPYDIFSKSQNDEMRLLCSKYGVSKVEYVEEVFIDLEGPRFDENFFKKLIPFRKNKKKVGQRFFQMVFKEGSAVLYSVTFEKSSGKIMVTNFSSEPNLQNFLLTGQAKTRVRKVYS